MRVVGETRRPQRAATPAARLAARAVAGDAEGAAAASRRRLQQQLGEARADDGADDMPVIDIAPAEEYSDGASERVVIPPPRPAAAPAGAPAPQLPQGWPDGAPPAVTASLALIPKQGAGGAIGRHRSNDPVTGFFVKCRLAWQLFFPPKPDKKRPAATAGDIGRQRLKMVLVADRAGAGPAGRPPGMSARHGPAGPRP
jgi:hypothetical protein